MIICSIKDKSLLNVIDNEYLKTKKELDEYIYKTRTMCTIKVERSFIEKEFIDKGLNFNDYVKSMDFINSLITIDADYEVDDQVTDVKDILDGLKGTRDVALYILNNPTFIARMKHSISRLHSMQEKIDSLSSNLMYVRKELETIKDTNNSLDKENNKLHTEVVNLSSRIRQIKDSDKKLHIDKYNSIIYIKENESVRHTYSLVTAIRNKLTTQGISSSCMVIAPKSADLLFEKWKMRNYVDLRSAYVADLVDSKTVLVDYSIINKMEVFLRNTVKSDVLIILDKSLSSRFIFSAKNIFLVDVGRFTINNFNHFGTIKDVNMLNYTIQDKMNYYCSNPVIDAIIREVVGNGTI